jgi:hypothetical protein
MVYEELLARVGAAIQPRDFVDWLLVKDVVALTWEIQRTRRIRQSLMRTSRLQAASSLLAAFLPGSTEFLDRESDADALARDWVNGDREAASRLKDLLKNAGLSLEDVTLRAISVNAREFDRLDQQDERHEQRRDSILRQIERRRNGWESTKQDTDQVVDAEFTVTPPALHKRKRVD